MKDFLFFSKIDILNDVFHNYPNNNTLNKINQDFENELLINIINKYKNEIEFKYLALNKYTPQIVYIKFIDEFIKLDTKYWAYIILSE